MRQLERAKCSCLDGLPFPYDVLSQRVLFYVALSLFFFRFVFIHHVSAVFLFFVDFVFVSPPKASCLSLLVR